VVPFAFDGPTSKRMDTKRDRVVPEGVVPPDAVKVERVFDSTLESVDEAEAMILDVAVKNGFHEDEQHHISMAVRECLVNAVVHGNRYNANKKVRVEVDGSPERLRIAVTDEGEGFELTDLPDPLAEENLLRHSGRGIFLIRAFMDEVSMRKLSPHGTEVVLVKERGRNEDK
jgi:serine/threonine-protein kinase RsbW